MSNYEEQANKFLQKTKTEITVTFAEFGKHFEDDKDRRDIYNVVISRGNRSFAFKFGQSLQNSRKYTMLTSYAKNKTKDIKHQLSKKDVMRLANHDYKLNKNFSEPTNYDILACLQKYDIGTFEDFCSEFGYNTDSRKAEKIYNAVLNEYKNVCIIWNDAEIEQLQEIE